MAAPVVSVHIYYPSAVAPVTGNTTAQIVSAFDLRKILYWNYGQPAIGSTAMVLVSYDMNGTVRLLWPATEFSAAKQASLDAGG